MGTRLFLLALLTEVFLMVLCLSTKSDQTRAKALVRIGALAVFALLVSLKVVEWSSRYYALSAVLVLFAALGVVDIARKRKVTFQGGHVVLRTAGMTALLFVAALPAIIFPQYSPLDPTGRYQVSTETFTYLDESRIESYSNTGESRKLNVGFWYPAYADGKYPLVVFSHGGIGTITSNESLYRELASHGYVVASISHTYHAIATTDEHGHTVWIDRGYLRELLGEDARANRQQSYEYYQKWMKVRTDDIDFVIDHVISEAAKGEANQVYKLVNTAAIGVMGHSAGGSAALAMGRIRADVGAVVALESPLMYDIKGVEHGEFAFTDEAYPVPVLNVYSDSIWGRMAEWPQYAQNVALLSDGPDTAFNVHIRGVGHLTLTDLALSSPILTRMLNRSASSKDTEYCLRTINKLSLEFFDCYLKKTGVFTPDAAY